MQIGKVLRFAATPAVVGFGLAVAAPTRRAQMVIAPVTQASWAEVTSLDETLRGAGGFGSKGAA